MRLVKLGGSILADKSRPLTFRSRVARRLARELEPFAADGLAVVHGAGGFGHAGARLYRLREGLRGPRQRMGAAVVQRDVRDMNLRVLDALLAAGVPAVSVPAGSFLELDGGRLAEFDAIPFQRALARGLVPVTFGDVLPDRARGVGIASGDQLMAALAGVLTPEVSVFVTSVDGVFDRDPARRGARLLEAVSPANAPRGGRRAAGGAADVTGAMGGKLAEAFAVAAHSGSTWVVGGMLPGNLAAALGGAPLVGTRVLPVTSMEGTVR